MHSRVVALLQNFPYFGVQDDSPTVVARWNRTTSYDIHSFDASGSERLLEVITTLGNATTPFFLSENERLISIERKAHFRLFRIYDFVKAPQAFELTPPLENFLFLQPTIYRATFGKQAT